MLTFDDGPDERYTPRILDILSKYKVPAAFFVTGINSEQNLPLVKRLYREGHEIGNHTFLHPNLELVSDDRLKLELRSNRVYYRKHHWSCYNFIQAAIQHRR